MLTHTQQTSLDYHLRQTNRLTNEELIQELTDHYTIALGEHMAQGMTFETALTNAQQAFGGIDGLQRMEQEYISGQNQVAWVLFRNVLWSYLKTPRLLITMTLLAGIYWLLVTFWQTAFITLLLVDVALCIVVGWPEWKWEPKRWRYEWENVPFGAYIKNHVGLKRITNITLMVSLNTPIFLYLFFFPFTFNRPFDGSFAVFAAIGITLSYIGFACIAELTYHRNTLLKRFV